MTTARVCDWHPLTGGKRRCHRARKRIPVIAFPSLALLDLPKTPKIKPLSRACIEVKRDIDAIKIRVSSRPHTHAMTLHAPDGSSFSWQIVNSPSGGFDASFRIERRLGGQEYTESDTLHALSRETAVGWVRTKAAVRGFDARQIK